MKFEELPETHQSALIDYREWATREVAIDKKAPKRLRRHYRDWKHMLMMDWSRAGSHWPDRDRYGWLHQLRNTFGPRWLNKLKMPD